MRIKLNDKGIMPTIGTSGSAGMDLHATEPVAIPAGSVGKIKTGVFVEIPDEHFGLLCLRSSLGKKGFTLANTIGIIDSDYRGEIIALVRNNNQLPQLINEEDRVAQLLIVPYLSPKIEVVEELSMTSRGSGGFGSTGA